MTQEDVFKQIQNSPNSKVKVAVTDIDGVLRGKYIHLSKFQSIQESGFGFCDVVFGWDCGDAAYENADFTGWHTGYPDALAKIDMGTTNARPMEYMVFSDYYGSVYDVGAFYASDRRDMGTNTIFDVETRIFDGKTGKVIWVGHTKTNKDSFHDRDTEGNVTEVAEAIKGALKSQDLIP